MLQYVIAGLVLGGVYAISAAGLVVTYLSAGVLNFSFGALAYFVARCYYFLGTQHHWAILPAAALSVLGVGPLMGVVLYLGLFRSLRLASPLAKVVTTLGLLVIVPAIATLVFGGQTILIAPGLAPQPVRVFMFLGVPVTMDEIIDYGCVVGVVLIGAIVLRYSDVGLRVRAMVDSPAMTSISGTNPDLVSIGVWAASSGLAGLAGVLTAPIIGLDAGDYTLLMVAAFAGVIAGRLRSLPIAVAVGLGLGVAEALLQYVLPSASSLTADILPSVPFAVTAVALLVFLWRRRAVDEAEGVGGALDRALATRGSFAGLSSRATTPVRGAGSGRASLAGFVVVAALPLVLPAFWVGMLEQGMAYGIVFLSMTLVTGEGGMIWLCQATFAGVGAVTMAQLAARHGWPVLAAAVAGAVLASLLGLLVGALTIRLGDIYVALVTLTFGLVTEMLVLDQNVFANFGRGVTVGPPQFAAGPKVFTWLELAVFGVLALGILNLRRSTTGLALNAARWSLPAARTTGIAVLKVKVLVSGLAAFVAGLGGALLAIALGDSLPSNYSTLGGILWLVVLVVLGIRSVMASLLAGLVFTIVTELAFVYLPPGLAGLIPLVFGIGATQIARFPDGWLGIVPRRILARRAERSPVAGRPAPSTAPPASA